MPLSITHTFVSAKADGNDPTLVRPSNWNATHTITGSIIESDLALTDVTTANVSTSKHGFAPKSPGDGTLYLDGTGAYSAPAGLLTSDNTWTGTNLFSTQLQVGNFPECDQAQLTVYFVMTPDTNSSMVDIQATSNGTTAAALNTIIYGTGTISGYINAIYTRTDVQSGDTNEATAIWIDRPIIDSGTLGVAYGLYISDFSLAGAGDPANIYSTGRSSKNYFEGIFTQSPFNQQQSGTITDGGSNNHVGQTLNGSGTEFTTQACVGDIITDGVGNVGQIINISNDTQVEVWPPNSFSSVNGVNVDIYPATIRLVDQLTSQGLSFAFNQSAFVISGFNGPTPGANNFVLGNANNMVNGETQASIVVGGQYNVVSGSESAILGGYANTVSGAESVALGGYGLTITGSQVVAMGLGENTYTLSQNNCFIVMDGKVGFGEVAPQAPLQITHDMGTGTLGTALRINAVSGGAGCGGQILWTDNGDVLQMAAISGADDDNWGGRMVFFTSPQTGNTPGGSLTERMRITSAGRIGINTVPIGVNGIFHVNATTHGAGIPTILVTESEYSDTIFSIQSKGRAMLNAYDDYTDAGPALIITQYGTNAGSALTVNQNGNGMGSGPAIIVNQNNSNNPAMVINGGFVGIGITPIFPLDIDYPPVSTDYGFVSLRIGSNTTESGLQINNNTADGRNYNIISTGTGSSAGLGNFVIADATAGLPRLSILPSGFVGIGTITPGGLFDVNGYLTVLSSGNTEASGTFSATVLVGGYQIWESGDSTIPIDWSKGNLQVLPLTLNTSPTFSNVLAGQRMTLVIQQDDTGGHTITWPVNVEIGSSLEINLAPQTTTTIDFTSVDGTNLIPITQFGPKALPGNPGIVQASGTFAAGDQNLTFVAVASGTAGNGAEIFFDTDTEYVETLVREVSGNQIYIALANTGSGSTATGNDIVSAFASGTLAADASAIATVSIPSPGTGFVGTGNVTLEGGVDQLFTPVGGELWFDGSNLYVGQSNGTFKNIAYTS